MTRNTLKDLNNHLFEQMERLNDESLSNEELEKEIQRTEAMTDVSTQIIANANTLLKAQSIYGGFGDSDNKKPELLEG